jgi:hypothetical protein
MLKRLPSEGYLSLVFFKTSTDTGDGAVNFLNKRSIYTCTRGTKEQYTHTLRQSVRTIDFLTVLGARHPVKVSAWLVWFLVRPLFLSVGHPPFPVYSHGLWAGRRESATGLSGDSSSRTLIL